MKILEIISSKHFSGGSQEHTRILSKGLRDKGHDVTVICRPGPIVEFYQKEGFRVIPMELRKKIVSIYKLYRFIRNEKPELVHTHNQAADIAGCIAAKMAKVPVIVSTLHISTNRDEFEPREENFTGWFYKFLLRKIPHKIITVSETIRVNTLKELEVSNDRVLTILNASDLEKLKVKIDIVEKKRELGILNDSSVIGSVGNLTMRKGYKYFLEAAKKIISEIPKTTFLIIGKGNLRSTLEKMAEEMNIRKNIIFAGYRKDIPELLCVMDIFVLPSLREGLPRSVIEASFLGKAVVGTRVDGVPEIVKNNETGILVPPKDANSLSEAILYLMKNPNKAKVMGENGKNLVKEKFNAVRMVNETEDLFLELIERNRK